MAFLWQTVTSGQSTFVCLDMVKLTTGKRLERDTVKLVVGEQLPKRGTCKHYRKSYRWLRFPCCGRAYPCDVCHNDVETHECEFANRMICGFCSKEQVSSSFLQIMFHFIHFWPISSNLLMYSTVLIHFQMLQLPFLRTLTINGVVSGLSQRQVLFWV